MIYCRKSSLRIVILVDCEFSQLRKGFVPLTPTSSTWLKTFYTYRLGTLILFAAQIPNVENCEGDFQKVFLVSTV